MTYNYTDYFNGPTLLSPNGGELFTTRDINITWLEPSDINAHDQLVWYEILFAESYSKIKAPNWITIAKLTTGNSSFTWNVSEYIKGHRCRIGIRAINSWGQTSKISYSASNFSIQDRKLPTPAVIEPTRNTNYYSYVPFILDKKGLIGACSQRAYYRIYYSSKKLEIDWTLIKGEIAIEDDPFYWDIRNILSSDDYSFKIELADEDNVSEPVFINDVIINSLNYFIIDTQPPIGGIKILDNTVYTKERNIVVKINPYDKSTAVKDFRIEQLNIYSSGNTLNIGPYKNISELSTWYIEEDDGKKLIQVKFRDYAENVLLNNENEEFFRTYESLNNTKITAFYPIEILGSYHIWTAFGGSSPQLYLNNNLISTLDGEATSLIYYDNILYIAIKNANNKGVLQRYIAETISDVYTIDEADSVINTMAIFDNKIFMGLENGKLISFNGSTISTVNTNNVFNYSIYNLTTNNNLLFIFLDKYQNIWTMRKDSAGNYYFSEIEINY